MDTHVEDVMASVCIAPVAVSRWMALLQKHAGGSEAALLLPQEMAVVETDGQLLVLLKQEGVITLQMHCAAGEWCWAPSARL